MSYRFAIVGCGRIARRHAQQITQRGIIQAVCDTVPPRADELAGTCRATPYYDIREMLAKEKTDIVCICTPNGLHAEHAILALQAGNHVLCEKPMTITTTDGRQMIDAARQAGKKLFVVKQNRYNPPVQIVKELLNGQKLGKIYSFQVNCWWNRPAAYYRDNWHGTRLLDGGTLFTQFSHFIDLVYWLLGDVQETSGWRYNYAHHNSMEFEDTGVATLLLKSGAMGTLHYTVNTHARNMEGSLTLIGEKGTVKIGGQYLNELEYFSVEGEPRPVTEPGRPANQYGLYEGSMSNHDKVYDHLLLALQDREHQSVEADDGLKTVEIIEKIYAASRLQTP